MAITISGANNVDKILATDGVLDSISGFNVVGVMTAANFDVTGKTTTGHLNVGSNIHIGNAGIITATTLVGNVTGNINHTSNLLLQISGSEKFRVGTSGQLGIGGANYGTSGQVLTSGGSGSAATWSTIASDKITEGNTEAEVVDTGSDGHLKVTTEGSERLRIDSSGNILTSGNTQLFGSNTSDGSDNKAIMINGGGAVSDSRGGYLLVHGNEHSSNPGIARLHAGNVGTAYVAFNTGGNERLRILSDGKVGINTSTPSQQFTSYAAAGYPILANGPSNAIGLGGNGAIVFGTKDIGSYAPGIIDASTLEFKISGSPKFNINSSGNLGLGESSSIDARLHVNSGTDNATLFLESTDGDVNLCMADNAGSCRLLQAGGNLRFRTGGNANAFGTGDSEKMVLDGNGRLLLGGGSSPSQVGDGRLIVYADTRLHPAIKADCIDGGVNRANGFTLLADNYQGDESICNIGISYSGAGLVLSRGVKVSNAADDAYLSSVDSYAMKPSVFKLDDSGDIIFLNTNTSATTTTDSAVSLSERLRITSAGKVGINNNNPAADLHIVTAGSSSQDGTMKLGGSDSSLGLLLAYDQAGATVSKITANPTYNNNSALLKICVDGDGHPDQLVLSGAGKIGINIADNTAADLQVRTGTNGAGVFRLGGASGNGIGMDMTYSNSGATSTIFKQNYRATNAGALMQFDSGYFVFKTGTGGTSRLSLKSDGSIVSHQLAGNEKGYPLVMGTATVAQNTNMSGSINMHDINGVHTTGGANYHIGGWVYLGNDYGPNPYPVRRFQIAKPGGFSNGTIVYQVWHDGDSNYYHGGLWEIRINCWTGSSRFESVTIRCINGSRDDLRVVAYNDTKGIMIQPSSIWGRVFIRRFGYDDGGRNPGSSYCAVANNAALAIYNSQGTDDGSMPTSGSPVDLYAFDGTSGSAGATHTGGYYIESSQYFDG